MTPEMATDLTLILGGVASGKSAFAEAYAHSTGARRLYIATAGEPQDSEMAEKIAAHQKRRGAGWSTLEAPLNVARALVEAGEADVILLDCLSMWLTNLMMVEKDIQGAVDELEVALGRVSAPAILVSNEVGLGGIEANTMARKFAREQGILNQRMAALATRVVLVCAGLPTVLKGSMDA